MRFFDDIIQMIRNRKFDFGIFSGEERYSRIRKRRFIFIGLILLLLISNPIIILILILIYLIIKPILKRTETTTINIKAEDMNNSMKMKDELQKYEDTIHDLKIRYQDKEDVARKIIKEHFPPPQMTYDRFMGEINSWNTIFLEQSNLALSIINMDLEYTEKVEQELRKRINILKSIVEKMEELTIELTLNLNNSTKNSDVGELEELLAEMQNVIDSVKEYG